MGQNYKNFMTNWKLFKKSSKCEVAGHSSFIGLKMALVWRKTMLIPKVQSLIYFQCTISVLTFFFTMQLKVFKTTWYPWANWRASNFLHNGAKNKNFTYCVHFLWYGKVKTWKSCYEFSNSWQPIFILMSSLNGWS